MRSLSLAHVCCLSVILHALVISFNQCCEWRAPHRQRREAMRCEPFSPFHTEARRPKKGDLWRQKWRRLFDLNFLKRFDLTILIKIRIFFVYFQNLLLPDSSSPRNLFAPTPLPFTISSIVKICRSHLFSCSPSSSSCCCTEDLRYTSFFSSSFDL